MQRGQEVKSLSTESSTDPASPLHLCPQDQCIPTMAPEPHHPFWAVPPSSPVFRQALLSVICDVTWLAACITTALLLSQHTCPQDTDCSLPAATLPGEHCTSYTSYSLTLWCTGVVILLSLFQEVPGCRWVDGRAAQSLESLEGELAPAWPGAAASLGPCPSERLSLRPCTASAVLVASPAGAQAPGRVKAQKSVCGSRKALLGGGVSE